MTTPPKSPFEGTANPKRNNTRSPRQPDDDVVQRMLRQEQTNTLQHQAAGGAQQVARHVPVSLQGDRIEVDAAASISPTLLHEDSHKNSTKHNVTSATVQTATIPHASCKPKTTTAVSFIQRIKQTAFPLPRRGHARSPPAQPGSSSRSPSPPFSSPKTKKAKRSGSPSPKAATGYVSSTNDEVDDSDASNFLDNDSEDEDNVVAPETARWVVEKYLMPLFERIGLFQSVYSGKNLSGGGLAGPAGTSGGPGKTAGGGGAPSSTTSPTKISSAGGNTKNLKTATTSTSTSGVPLLDELRLSDRLLHKLQEYRKKVAVETNYCAAQEREKEQQMEEVQALQKELKQLQHWVAMDGYRRKAEMERNLWEKRGCEEKEIQLGELSESLAARVKENKKLHFLVDQQERIVSQQRFVVAKHLRAASLAKLKNDVLEGEIRLLRNFKSSNAAAGGSAATGHGTTTAGVVAAEGASTSGGTGIRNSTASGAVATALGRGSSRISGSARDSTTGTSTPAAHFSSSLVPHITDADLEKQQKKFAQQLSDQFQAQDEIELKLSTLVSDKNNLEAGRTALMKRNEELLLEKDSLLEEETELRIALKEQLKEALNEKDTMRKERDKLEMKVKDLSADRDTLKQRLKKYRRLKVDEHKTCKNCNKEYSEQDNFNWSCRTHSSEYGGEMWWCCGKLGKDAIGCKFSKHESKDEDDDLDEQDRAEREERENKTRNAKIKCYSCKETGHIAKNCPKDPNLRTLYDPVPDLNRIEVLALSQQLRGKKKKGTTMGSTSSSASGTTSGSSTSTQDDDASRQLKLSEIVTKIDSKLGFVSTMNEEDLIIDDAVLDDVVDLCAKAREKFYAQFLLEEEAKLMKNHSEEYFSSSEEDEEESSESESESESNSEADEDSEDEDGSGSEHGDGGKVNQSGKVKQNNSGSDNDSEKNDSSSGGEDSSKLDGGDSRRSSKSENGKN
ncbi:unnamed protein product [Amoebophrya sp. A120]|nr:unnamed protein product [Amoebophrya sp. A120]|eukprot:GSA120T00007988001.1